MASFIFYCPDHHLTYRGDTPDSDGVGGGVTARIHLARALARRGHEVSAYVNTPSVHDVDEARFVPFRDAGRLAADLVVLNSSGGDLSLAPAAELSIDTRNLTLWVHGVSPISGLDRFDFDRVVVPSQFVAEVVDGNWSIPSSTVIPNGFQRYPVGHLKRDPYRLVYTSHPAKGLHSALEVLDLLRKHDKRFELHIYGGAALWGQAPELVAHEAVVDHGLVGQQEVARALRQAGFALHLQAIPEAFSISVSEAMAAGAIVVASPVGALAERIRSGRNGVSVPGDHNAPETVQRAAEAILRLLEKPRKAEKIRRRAIDSVVDWDDVAVLWEGLLG